ncbi:MAG TPA: hypothetical protein VK788_08920 [Terriglobales bacterium]|nr:hypothetical protein [Terriglobales bacterium]
MLSKMLGTSALIVALSVLACTAWAQSIEIGKVNPATHTLTITIKGTIGPILSGTDPLGLDGQTGTVKILASESLNPTKHTATSATYTLPAGAITVTAGSNKFSTKSPSKMVINLTSTADTLTFIIAGKVDGVSLMVTDTSYLKAGSWTTAVLKHPGVFSPSPQKLTAAKTAGGPGSKIKYTVFGGTSVLGFTGTASNSATVDPVLPEDDLDY